MSKTNKELEAMMNLRADFDQFLCEKDEDNARACIDQMGESYSELEALKMHQEFNRAFDPIVPFTQEIPVMTEAEKRAWTEPYLNTYDHSNGRDAEMLEEQHLRSLDEIAGA